MIGTRIWNTVLIGFSLLLGIPPVAAAQDRAPQQPTWVSDIGVAGANIAVGAATAAITAAIRGTDVSEAFLKGAAGGGVVFAGKRIAVEQVGGAGLLGRQIASVGSSIVVNGGAGRAWLSEVWLPLGPLSLQVRRAAGVRARLSLPDVGTLIWAATRSELHFDLERSISNGSAVFVAPDHEIHLDSDRVGGFASGGVVVLGGVHDGIEVRQRHENVHVLQHDFMLQAITRPIEQWAWGRITERNIPLDLGLVPLLIYGGFVKDLHQREAEALQLR